VNVYTPEEFVVVVAVAAPLKATVAPLPPVVGLIVPEMLKVCAASVKFTPVILELFTDTLWLLGLKLYPVWLGVTA
jgi:hypothetical protein